MLKKLTHWKKKIIPCKQFNSHCSYAPLFREQWSMPPLFTEQWTHASPVQWTVHHATLFIEQCSMVELRAAQESNIFLLFIYLCFARNLLWDLCIVNNFFVLTKYLLSTFLKKHNLYLIAKRAVHVLGQSLPNRARNLLVYAKTQPFCKCFASLICLTKLLYRLQILRAMLKKETWIWVAKFRQG